MDIDDAALKLSDALDSGHIIASDGERSGRLLDSSFPIIRAALEAAYKAGYETGYDDGSRTTAAGY